MNQRENWTSLFLKTVRSGTHVNGKAGSKRNTVHCSIDLSCASTHQSANYFPRAHILNFGWDDYLDTAHLIYASLASSRRHVDLRHDGVDFSSLPSVCRILTHNPALSDVYFSCTIFCTNCSLLQPTWPLYQVITRKCILNEYQQNSAWFKPASLRGTPSYLLFRSLFSLPPQKYRNRWQTTRLVTG